VNLEEQCMEFHLHVKHYKLYSSEDSIFKGSEPKQEEKNEET
jgi:hypothetical protein